MEEILEIINRGNGVLGSAILGGDGKVVAANFRECIKVEEIARFAQTVGTACEQALSAGGRGNLRRATLDGPAGRLLIYGLQEGFLAILADRAANVGLLRLSVERAVAGAASTERAA